MLSCSELSDPELVSLVKEDSRTAYTEIFNRYNKLLYSHAYNKLRDEAESRDVVQEVFMNLWERRYVIQDSNLVGLLFTMIRNRIINLVAHQKVVTDYVRTMEVAHPGKYKATDHLVREKQLAAIIEAEIEALPPRMQEIFRMSRQGHMSNKEIAAKLGLSEHTVADQVKKSLRTLRTRLGLPLFIIFWLFY